MKIKTAIAFLIMCSAAAMADSGKDISPAAIALDSKTSNLYIAASQANSIIIVDISNSEIIDNITIDSAACGIALNSPGNMLYVACGNADGRILAVDTKSRTVKKTFKTAHSPVSPVVSPDGKRLYVCCRFSDSMQVFDTQTGKLIATISMAREPIAADITPDGRYVCIANHLPHGSADTGYASAEISIIDAEKNRPVARVSLPTGSTGLRGLCICPEGTYAYVTHILARYQYPTTQLDRGWMNTNALSIIDIKAGKLLNTVLLDDVDRGAANPWAIECSSDSRHLYVSHAGTHEISIIDRFALHKRLDSAAASQQTTAASARAADVPNDLSFLKGIRKRIRLAGNGPRAIASAENRIFIANHFSDSIDIIDISKDTQDQLSTIELSGKRRLSQARKGQMLFNDASLCFQNWQSCASCHPDGRADGLNWDLLNDGLGNPKQTKSMLYTHFTPPVMITGIRDKAETAVRAGIRYIQFASRPESDAVAIDEYLRSLHPVPSPYMIAGQLSPSAKRGKIIFENAGCISCHSGKYYTDMKKYNVGTGRGPEAKLQFDTPSLIELWRTAPYLYDGRATTIKQVLTTHNPDDLHGITSDLDEKQINDLAEYLLSL